MGKYIKKLKKKIYNNHEYLIEQFLISEEKKMKSNQIILDAGAGQCQYKYIFAKRHKYLAQDLCIGDKNWDFSQIDIKSPIEKIPIKSNYFDYIILTQVLEHVPDPQKVMIELSRLLKPGGKILCSAPQCFGEHQIPYNYFNYTRYGIENLAKNAKLKMIFVAPMGGYFTLMGQMRQRGPYILFGEGLFTKIVFYPYRLIIAVMGLALDRFDVKKDTTVGYLVILKKQDEIIKL